MDPIEKNHYIIFFGTDVYSMDSIGCDFSCQNWEIARENIGFIEYMDPEELI